MRHDWIDRDREELAERLRERDRHREPRRSWPHFVPLSRWAFQAHILDRLNEAAAARAAELAQPVLPPCEPAETER